MQFIEEHKNLVINFQYSETVIKYYAKSFYFAANFLPKERRLAAYAVYAFCRYADNVVDNPRNRSKEEILNEVNILKEELRLAYKYGESEHPALSAFIYVAKRYDIPQEYPMDLIDGVQMDIDKARYKTFDELYEFAYKVASTVGLMMTCVMGFSDKTALVYAESLGIGMQITNILRDIQEDKNLGRIYLPLDELQEFNIAEEDIINEVFSNNMKKYMAYKVAKARDYYSKSNLGIPLLQPESQFAISTASRIYSGILDKIEQNNYNPFLGRVSLSYFEKVKILTTELAASRLKRIFV